MIVPCPWPCSQQKCKCWYFNLSLKKHLFLYTREGYRLPSPGNLGASKLEDILKHILIFDTRVISLTSWSLIHSHGWENKLTKLVLFSLSIESIFTELTLNDYCKELSIRRSQVWGARWFILSHCSLLSWKLLLSSHRTHMEAKAWIYLEIVLNSCTRDKEFGLVFQIVHKSYKVV